MLSSTAQIVQAHKPRLKPFHEEFGVRKTRSYDGKALYDLVADRRTPVTKCQIILQSGVGAFAVKEAKLDRSSN
jgi:hypothetical protein